MFEITEMYYYQYLQLLNEVDDDDDCHRSPEELENWNKKQKTLWMELVQLKKVEKNDVTKFYKFGHWFKQFYDKAKQHPSLRDALKIL